MQQRLILTLAVAGVVSNTTPPHSNLIPPMLVYRVTVDTTGWTGWEVELQLRNAPDTFHLAMAAHSEYDDAYWRYLTDVRGVSPDGAVTIVREDSALWRVAGPGGAIRLHYRLALPRREGPPRAAWRPVLTPDGAFLGGPHTFMYLPGAESVPAHVILEIPQTWRVATALVPTADPRTFYAPDAATLMESPMLAGRFASWSFAVEGVPHRIVYWPGGSVSFDSTRFRTGIARMVRAVVDLFGEIPYRDYTFLIQDSAYGGLEHPSSVTLGQPSATLREDPYASLLETAHEFIHTWNLLRIPPVEYRALDYRTQPPTSGLWFSEGLTLFYADLLLRRARLPTSDSTRIGHLERMIARYLASPGNAHYSAEAVSRVAYNAPPGSLGDYGASTHLQGELIGTMLDAIIRDATDGARSMDDVMRLMLQRFGGGPGFRGRDVEQSVEDVCACDVTPFFDAHVRGGGNPIAFDRYLVLLGLGMRVTFPPAMWQGQPERDLRIYAWDPPGESYPRLVVTDPGSSWARAGLHTGDQLLAMDGTPVASWPAFRARLVGLALGDTVRLEVQRPTERVAATVAVTGFTRPRVVIEPLPAVDSRRTRLRAQWMQGR